MRFNNGDMAQPVPGKPHLALIHGYWRVSPRPKRPSPEVRVLWQQAHNHIDKLNTGRHHSACMSWLV